MTAGGLAAIGVVAMNLPIAQTLKFPVRTLLVTRKEDGKSMNTALACFHKEHPNEASLVARYVLGIIMLLVTVLSILLNTVIAIVLYRTSLIDKPIRPHITGMVVASLFDLLSAIASRWFIFMGLPYTAAVLLTVHMNIIGCHKRVSPYTLGFSYGCSECGGYTLALRILHMNSAMAQGSRLPPVKKRELILILHMNSAMAQGNRLPPVKKRELILVVQFSLVCAAQFLGSASFYFLPPLAGYSDIAYYLTTIFSSLNTMTNPCVIIAFHRNVRRVVWAYLLTAGRGHTAVITISGKLHPVMMQAHSHVN
ncbi:hypothetical protein OSTOST_06178 [Ostertagia ostertagi]